MKDDVISRQAAIDAIYTLKHNYPSSCFKDLCKAVDIAIKALSAQLEQRWIPCSERLPEESGRYIITAYDGVSRRTATAVFQKRLGGWCLSGRMAYWRVVAWMPPPEPYKEEGEK